MAYITADYKTFFCRIVSPASYEVLTAMFMAIPDLCHDATVDWYIGADVPGFWLLLLKASLP